MVDWDKEKSDQEETVISEQEEGLEKKIKKVMDNLKFYLEEGDELCLRASKQMKLKTA